MYAPFWLIGYRLKVQGIFGNTWQPWVFRVLALGVLVLIPLWFLNIKRGTRGLLYVVAMILGGFVIFVWMNRRGIGSPAFGWGGAFSTYVAFAPVFLGGGLGVIGLLWLMRRYRPEGARA